MQIEEFLSSLKPFSKLFIFGSLIVGAMVSLSILNPQLFVLLVPKDLKNPIKYITTLFFMKGIKMATLTNLLFAYYTINGLETSFLPNRYGDFLYLILISFFGNYVNLKGNSCST